MNRSKATIQAIKSNAAVVKAAVPHAGAVLGLSLISLPVHAIGDGCDYVSEKITAAQHRLEIRRRRKNPVSQAIPEPLEIVPEGV